MVKHAYVRHALIHIPTARVRLSVWGCKRKIRLGKGYFVPVCICLECEFSTSSGAKKRSQWAYFLGVRFPLELQILFCLCRMQSKLTRQFLKNENMASAN